jgi:predicted hydrocarbon binding protein
MGVRPPADDSGDKPESIEFGIAALVARLEELDISFPTTAESLGRTYGDIQIPVDAAGHTMKLQEALEHCDRREFESRQELLNAVHPVFEAKRESLSTGIIGRLRTLVPF